MAMAYIKVFFDWTEITALLSAEEKGRLIDALVCYGRDGSGAQLLAGNERFVFATLTKRLDADARRYERACAGVSRARAGLRKKEDKEDYEDEEDYEDYEDYEDEEPSVLQKINDNWRTSVRARGATAQHLVNQLVYENTACSRASNLYDLVLTALEAGIEPGEILELGRDKNPGALGSCLYELGEGMCS